MTYGYLIKLTALSRPIKPFTHLIQLMAQFTLQVALNASPLTSILVVTRARFG